MINLQTMFQSTFELIKADRRYLTGNCRSWAYFFGSTEVLEMTNYFSDSDSENDEPERKKRKNILLLEQYEAYVAYLTANERPVEGFWCS